MLHLRQKCNYHQMLYISIKYEEYAYTDRNFSLLANIDNTWFQAVLESWCVTKMMPLDLNLRLLETQIVPERSTSCSHK